MQKRPAFSVIETTFAVMLIILLSCAILPIGSSYTDMGHHPANKALVGAVATAVSQYKFDTGAYPASLADLTEPKGSYGPWLNDFKLKDSNGTLLNYAYTTEAAQFAVWSNGGDKTNNSGASVPSEFKGDDIGVLINY